MKTILYLTLQQQETLDKLHTFLQPYQNPAGLAQLKNTLQNKENAEFMFPGWAGAELNAEIQKFMQKLFSIEDEYKQLLIIADQLEPILNKHRVSEFLDKQQIELFATNFVRSSDDSNVKSLGSILFQVKPEITRKGIKAHYTRGLPFFKETMEYLVSQELCSPGDVAGSYTIKENVTSEHIDKALIDFYTQRLSSMTLLQLVKEASSQEGMSAAEAVSGGERNQLMDDFLIGKNPLITSLKQHKEMFALYSIVADSFIIGTQLDQMVNGLEAKKDDINKFLLISTRFLAIEMYRPMLDMIKELFWLDQLIINIKLLQLEKTSSPDQRDMLKTLKSKLKDAMTSMSTEDRHAEKIASLNSLITLLEHSRKEMLEQITTPGEAEKQHAVIVALINRFGADYSSKFGSNRLSDMCKNDQFDYEQYQFERHPKYDLIVIANELIARLDDMLEQGGTAPLAESFQAKTLFFSRASSHISTDTQAKMKSLKETITRLKDTMESEASDEVGTWRQHEKSLLLLGDTKVGHKALDGDMATEGSLRQIMTKDREKPRASHHASHMK